MLTRTLVLTFALSAGVARAQDGGVYVYDRAALLLPSGAVLTMDAGVALDGPVAIARANELLQLRAQQSAPSWVSTAAAVVAVVVWAVDRVRDWATPRP